MKRFGAVVAACSGTSATTAADAWPVYEAEGSSIAVPETWLATSHDPAALEVAELAEANTAGGIFPFVARRRGAGVRVRCPRQRPAAAGCRLRAHPR